MTVDLMNPNTCWQDVIPGTYWLSDSLGSIVSNATKYAECIGVYVKTQQEADLLIPRVQDLEAHMRFLVVDPAEPLRLSGLWFTSSDDWCFIDWLIIESVGNPGKVPFIKELVRQARAANVPFWIQGTPVPGIEDYRQLPLTVTSAPVGAAVAKRAEEIITDFEKFATNPQPGQVFKIEEVICFKCCSKRIFTYKVMANYGGFVGYDKVGYGLEWMPLSEWTHMLRQSPGVTNVDVCSTSGSQKYDRIRNSSIEKVK